MSSPDMPNTDVVIIGAGPAGLALARALGEAGLGVALVERQPRAALEAPGFDGREIALTHRSVAGLRRLDAWRRIPAEEISPLGEARVLNGNSARALRFFPTGQAEPLGHLVPNHLIRRALFESVAACDQVALQAGTAARIVAPADGLAGVMLGDGTKLSARLVVAADTRFSALRRQMGIGARMRDFGKTMLVCRMAHDIPHGAVATEWFAYGQTIALLPLNGTPEAPNLSSLVITLRQPEAARLLELGADAFNADITRRLEGRLGEMRLVSERNFYPLVATYADRFAAPRFALLGDAAVGMHPVTAHGFNFGLVGQELLTGLVVEAARRGGDIGAPTLLARYEAALRRATAPLWHATNATALLYTDDRLPARALRDAMIFGGAHLRPLRRAVVGRLMAM